MEKNYVPGSMGFSEGMLVGPSLCAGATIFMLVDEKKARSIIKGLLKDGRNIERAELGLDGDWSENSTEIYDGKFHKYDAYHGSPWATPTLIVYFKDASNEAYESWQPKEVKL